MHFTQIYQESTEMGPLDSESLIPTNIGSHSHIQGSVAGMPDGIRSLSHIEGFTAVMPDDIGIFSLSDGSATKMPPKINDQSTETVQMGNDEVTEQQHHPTTARLKYQKPDSVTITVKVINLSDHCVSKYSDNTQWFTDFGNLQPNPGIEPDVRLHKRYENSLKSLRSKVCGKTWNSVEQANQEIGNILGVTPVLKTSYRRPDGMRILIKFVKAATVKSSKPKLSNEALNPRYSDLQYECPSKLTAVADDHCDNLQPPESPATSTVVGAKKQRANKRKKSAIMESSLLDGKGSFDDSAACFKPMESSMLNTKKVSNEETPTSAPTLVLSRRLTDDEAQRIIPMDLYKGIDMTTEKTADAVLCPSVTPIERPPKKRKKTDTTMVRISQSYDRSVSPDITSVGVFTMPNLVPTNLQSGPVDPSMPKLVPSVIPVNVSVKKKRNTKRRVNKTSNQAKRSEKKSDTSLKGKETLVGHRVVPKRAPKMKIKETSTKPLSEKKASTVQHFDSNDDDDDLWNFDTDLPNNDKKSAALQNLVQREEKETEEMFTPYDRLPTPSVFGDTEMEASAPNFSINDRTYIKNEAITQCPLTVENPSVVGSEPLQHFQSSPAQEAHSRPSPHSSTQNNFELTQHGRIGLVAAQADLATTSNKVGSADRTVYSCIRYDEKRESSSNVTALNKTNEMVINDRPGQTIVNMPEQKTIKMPEQIKLSSGLLQCKECGCISKPDDENDMNPVASPKVEELLKILCKDGKDETLQCDGKDKAAHVPGSATSSTFNSGSEEPAAASDNTEEWEVQDSIELNHAKEVEQLQSDLVGVTSESFEVNEKMGSNGCTAISVDEYNSMPFDLIAGVPALINYVGGCETPQTLTMRKMWGTDESPVLDGTSHFTSGSSYEMDRDEYESFLNNQAYVPDEYNVNLHPGGTELSGLPFLDGNSQQKTGLTGAEEQPAVVRTDEAVDEEHKAAEDFIAKTAHDFITETANKVGTLGGVAEDAYQEDTAHRKILESRKDNLKAKDDKQPAHVQEAGDFDNDTFKLDEETLAMSFARGAMNLLEGKGPFPESTKTPQVYQVEHNAKEQMTAKLAAEGCFSNEISMPICHSTNNASPIKNATPPVATENILAIEKVKCNEKDRVESGDRVFHGPIEDEDFDKDNEVHIDSVTESDTVALNFTSGSGNEMNRGENESILSNQERVPDEHNVNLHPGGTELSRSPILDGNSQQKTGLTGAEEQPAVVRTDEDRNVSVKKKSMGASVGAKQKRVRIAKIAVCVKRPSMSPRRTRFARAQAKAVSAQGMSPIAEQRTSTKEVTQKKGPATRRYGKKSQPSLPSGDTTSSPGKSATASSNAEEKVKSRKWYPNLEEQTLLYANRMFVVEAEHSGKNPMETTLWRVLHGNDSKVFLQKFLPHDLNGRMLHFATDSYKYYESKDKAFFNRFHPVFHNVVFDGEGSEVVQYHNIDRVTPCLLHMKTVTQSLFISHVIVCQTIFIELTAPGSGRDLTTPGHPRYDIYYKEAWDSIEQALIDRAKPIIESSRMRAGFITPLKLYPVAKFVKLNAKKAVSANCVNCSPRVKIAHFHVEFLRPPYDPYTFEDLPGDYTPPKDFNLCYTCTPYFRTVHKLLHHKWRLYACIRMIITDWIGELQEDEFLDRHQSVETFLADHEWHRQSFAEFQVILAEADRDIQRHPSDRNREVLDEEN